jgi:type VI protein secretion system component Hcp
MSVRMRLDCVSMGAILGAALSASAFAASSDYYLKIKGVDGESTKAAASSDKPRIAVLEVQSWSWGASQTSGTHAGGGGGGAGKVSMNDISVASAPQAGKPLKQESLTIKQSGAAAGGVSVAAGDVTGDGRADGAAVPAVTPATFDPRANPAPQGSVRVKVKLPWLACRVGARFPELELGGRGARTYRLIDAVVTSCGDPHHAGDRPQESISLNYAKLE